MRGAVWALLLLVACSVQAQQLTIKKADRKINLKTQVVKVADSLEITASGGSSDAILVCYPTRLVQRLAHIRVSVSKERVDPVVPADAPPGAPPGASCYSAPVKMSDGETVAVDVAASFTGVLTPNPAKITQGEKDRMEYDDTLWVLSPYAIQDQTTTATLPSSNVLAYKPKSKATKTDTKITWSGLGAAEPWSTKHLKLHFEAGKPFKKVTKLVREIEVSHWGNIYVEESYIIRNDGAQHEGAFSRLKHSGGQTGNSFQQLKARLPPSAHSLYYRDLIGNVSSSNTRKSFKETVVEINLRYPLMGGWEADFVLGYSVPLDGFLYHRPNGRNRLIIDLSSPIEDVIIEDLEVRVVLPEGSQKIKQTLPFDMDVSHDKKYTYLDTVGRPVLVLRKTNLISVHDKPFAVDYSFGTGALLSEPLLLIAVFAAFFVAVAVYHRLEFTISKDDKWLEARAKEEASATLQKLSGIWDAEADQLAVICGAAESLDDAGGIEAAQNTRQAAERRLDALDKQAKPLIEALEAISSKAAAIARDHAAAGKALQSRAGKLVSERADLLRKGSGSQDAAKKTAAATRALQDARAEWVAATVALCD